ncbi:hypothetical protein LEP1GSC072_0199 [Leptospira noguchii str. Bonito]|nr:hypothetical protein LEP1GSC072_0199 [Leptospira noguchii str. Bonito]
MSFFWNKKNLEKTLKNSLDSHFKNTLSLLKMLISISLGYF